MNISFEVAVDDDPSVPAMAILSWKNYHGHLPVVGDAVMFAFPKNARDSTYRVVSRTWAAGPDADDYNILVRVALEDSGVGHLVVENSKLRDALRELVKWLSPEQIQHGAKAGSKLMKALDLIRG